MEEPDAFAPTPEAEGGDFLRLPLFTTEDHSLVGDIPDFVVAAGGKKILLLVCVGGWEDSTPSCLLSSVRVSAPVDLSRLGRRSVVAAVGLPSWGLACIFSEFGFVCVDDGNAPCEDRNFSMIVSFGYVMLENVLVTLGAFLAAPSSLGGAMVTDVEYRRS